MSNKKVYIFADEHMREHEHNVLSGVLRFYRISVLMQDINKIEQFNERKSNGLIILFTSYFIKCSLSHLDSKNIIVYAGRQITNEYLNNAISRIRINEILIYGEPYKAIIALISNTSLTCKLKGKMIKGGLIDINNFCPSVSHNSKQKKVLVSIGCQNKCSYCSYGCTHLALYGNHALWRSRIYDSIKNEFLSFIDNETHSVLLTGDQVFSASSSNNEALFSLSEYWKENNLRKFKMTFTISPTEFSRNKELINNLAKAFRIYPAVSIDSFDERTVRLFNLKHTNRMVYDCLGMLASLRIPFRVNYILLRPWMNNASLHDELENFQKLNEITDYFSTGEKYILMYELFSKCLQPNVYTTLSKYCKSYNSQKVISHKCLPVVFYLQNALLDIAKGKKITSEDVASALKEAMSICK